jgi:hypothetical protein
MTARAKVLDDFAADEPGSTDHDDLHDASP